MVEMEPGIRQALDDASTGFVSYEQLLERFLKALTKAGLQNDGQGVALWAAFSFHRDEQKGFTGSYAGSDPGEPWPTDPRQVPADVLAVWAAYAAHARHPGVRARLHHLLWEARKGDAFQHARQAIEAYRDAAAEFLNAPERDSGQVRACDCLTVAQDLAASLRQTALEDSVRSVMTDFVTAMLDEGDDAPGLVLQLLRALSVRRPVDEGVRRLLGRACDRYASDAFVLVDLLELCRDVETDVAARTGLDRRIVTTVLEDAERLSGFMRIDRLSTAATMARDRGLADLHDEAVLRMQRTDPEHLGMSRFEETIRVPKAMFDAYTQWVGGASTLGEALGRLAAVPSPAGTSADAQNAAQRIAQSSVFLSVVATVRINPVGPVPVAPAGVDPLANHAAQWRLVSMELAGLCLAAALDQIGERFDPDEYTLVELLTHPPVVPTGRARRLTLALLHYWRQEYTAAYSLALPRVEGLLRELLRQQDVPVVRVAQGDTRGGASLLGTLIDRMTEAGLDPDWQDFLRLLLTDGARGMNLRNDELHDLADDEPQPHRVALVLLADLYLVSRAHQPNADETADPQEG
ncbi:hypothetical protein [Streptomyces sp. NBC_01615]|uniref:DUF7380 domain-containing protein n=1 Tax=Streptomyces sp. NBC_01615 TaxID=2975898 RepID=UPI00386C5044